jgi:hypothetical protein
VTRSERETPIDYAVICRTCLVVVWQGNVAPDDGQPLLTAHAESVPGPACPSKVATCPHKTAARAEAAKRKPATLKDISDLQTRVAQLETKPVKP